jgi:hypothetical protein
VKYIDNTEGEHHYIIQKLKRLRERFSLLKKLGVIALASIIALTGLAGVASADTESSFYQVSSAGNTSIKHFTSFSSGSTSLSVYDIPQNGREFFMYFVPEDVSEEAALAKSSSTAAYEIQRKDGLGIFQTWKTVEGHGEAKWYVKLGTAFPDGTYRIKVTYDSPDFFFAKTGYSGKFYVK